MDEKKEALLKLIDELMQAAEDYGYGNGLDSLATHEHQVLWSTKRLKAMKKEIQALKWAVRKAVESL